MCESSHVEITNMANNLKRGIYETDSGNAAYVPSSKSCKAFDLDMGEWIPISLVTTKFLRRVEDEDIEQASNSTRELYG
jgi:hypothetical protein